LFTRTLRRVLAEDFPEVESVSVIDTDLTTTEAIERRADTVLKAETAAGSRLLVIEPQTDRKEEKVRGWAYYLAFLENKYRIPASLMVLTPKAGTARWARGPLTLGPAERPSMRLFPFVCGPDNMPFITEPEQAAEDAVFAVLALLSHRLDPDVEKALRPLADALDRLEPVTASFWSEFAEGGLGEGCTQDTWRNIMKTMKYGYVSETRREARAEARAEALSEAILAFFDDRGIPLGQTERERITTCEDSELLMRWVLRAPSVDSTEELFAE
jgi:hypothetical protein